MPSDEVDAASLPFEDLVQALRRQAAGSPTAEAAVELLVAHGTWLQRSDFRARVDVQPALVDDRLLASIDWRGALHADLPASSSERQMLQLAAELAGVDSGVALGDLLVGLDERNAAIFLRAVALAERRSGSSSSLRPSPAGRRRPPPSTRRT